MSLVSLCSQYTIYQVIRHPPKILNINLLSGYNGYSLSFPSLFLPPSLSLFLSVCLSLLLLCSSKSDLFLLPLGLQRNNVFVCMHYILSNCHVLFELTQKLTLKIGFLPFSLDLRLAQHVF